MALQAWNHLVFYLSVFSFTTDYAIGRIFMLFVLLLKRQFTIWKRLENQPQTELKLKQLFKQLIQHRRTPLFTAIQLKDLELVKLFIEIQPENVNMVITDAD